MIGAPVLEGPSECTTSLQRFGALAPTAADDRRRGGGAPEAPVDAREARGLGFEDRPRRGAAQSGGIEGTYENSDRPVEREGCFGVGRLEVLGRFFLECL